MAKRSRSAAPIIPTNLSLFDSIPDCIMTSIVSLIPFEERTALKDRSVVSEITHPLMLVGNKRIFGCVKPLRNYHPEHKKSDTSEAIMKNRIPVSLEITHLSSGGYALSMVHSRLYITTIRFTSLAHSNQFWLFNAHKDHLTMVEHLIFDESLRFDALCDYFMRFTTGQLHHLHTTAKKITLPRKAMSLYRVHYYDPYISGVTLVIDGVCTLPGIIPSDPVKDDNDIRCEREIPVVPRSGPIENCEPLVRCTSIGHKFVPCSLACVFKGIVKDCKYHGFKRYDSSLIENSNSCTVPPSPLMKCARSGHFGHTRCWMEMDREQRPVDHKEPCIYIRNGSPACPTCIEVWYKPCKHYGCKVYICEDCQSHQIYCKSHGNESRVENPV